MQLHLPTTTITLVQGDITTQKTDAIVNAANSGLAGGGGVDGAIHRAGGPSILAECRKIGGCPTGQARITGAGNLPARFVIHAVGPIYRNGFAGESELLTSAYRNSFQLAAQRGLRTIAFPSISTGVYSYPVQEAARLALAEVVRFLKEETHQIEQVTFVLFDAKTLAAYEEALGALQ